MTLATQCPHCNTTFRVDENQLAAYNGLVRCGVCARVFNGNDFIKTDDAKSDEQLFEEAAAQTHVTPNTLPTGNTAAPAPSITPEPGTDNSGWDMPARESAPAFAYTARQAPSAGRTEPSLEDDGSSALTIEEDLPEADPGDLDAVGAPVSQAGAHNEPTFIKANRRRQRIRKTLNIVMGIAAIPLLLLALGQGAYFWRHQLASAFPPVKPLLVAACAKLHCKVGVSTDIDQLSLESNELETLPESPDTFALTLLLRNNGAIAQAWPHIELTLNDPAEKAQIIRVFTPAEYLPDTVIVPDGFKEHSEQQITVRFTLSDAVASGYRVYLFYP